MSKIYDFDMKDYKGKTFSFKQFEGMVIIVVNVASKCGLSNTSYERMKTIYHEHQNVVLILCLISEVSSEILQYMKSSSYSYK